MLKNSNVDEANELNQHNKNKLSWVDRTKKRICIYLKSGNVYSTLHVGLKSHNIMLALKNTCPIITK